MLVGTVDATVEGATAHGGPGSDGGKRVLGFSELAVVKNAMPGSGIGEVRRVKVLAPGNHVPVFDQTGNANVTQR
jgi:hypothetical protein